MLVWYGGSGTDMAELKSMGQGPWGTERSKQRERRLQDPETQSERCREAERQKGEVLLGNISQVSTVSTRRAAGFSLSVCLSLSLYLLPARLLSLAHVSVCLSVYCELSGPYYVPYLRRYGAR